MKKIITLCLFFFLLLCPKAAEVKGRIVDQNNNPLSDLDLTLYTPDVVGSPGKYYTQTLADGTFTFSEVTNVKPNKLPNGYSVSNNYPNPFNPVTRMNIDLPKRSHIKIDIFNILGEKVNSAVNSNYDSGTHNIDFHLNGLPNGIYFATVIIDDKFSIIKKNATTLWK